MKLRRAVPVLGLLPALVAPVAARAQQPAAPACNIDQNKPGSVQKATLSLVRLQGSTRPEEKGRLLTEMVKMLSSEKSKDNPAGQDYMWANALINWAAEPGMSGVVKRSDLGYTTDPTGMIDVFAAADSALTRLAAVSPGCAAQAAQLRQNQAWLNQVNGAIQALNGTKADSAEYFARRSLVMYQASPYPYHVLSVVAQNKNDMAAATANWAKVVETAGTDTSYRDLRNSAMFNIAVTRAQMADEATGADKAAKAKEAATALQAFIDAAPGTPDAARAQPTLARMLMLGGDKAAVARTYADQLANPSNYGDLALTQGGVIASQSSDTVAAAKLFEAAVAQNPYSRDGLNNLSAIYLQQKQFSKIVPIAQRLITIDPSNGDNYAFLSLAYNGLATAATAAQKKALNDSALKYYQMSEAIPVKVTFSEFSRGEARAAIAMDVEVLKTAPPPATPATPARTGAARGTTRPAAAAAAKPDAAAAAPKTFTLKLEFLDKNGNVVDTQTQTVGPIAPGERKTARFEAAKPGIVAFRYDALK